MGMDTTGHEASKRSERLARWAAAAPGTACSMGSCSQTGAVLTCGLAQAPRRARHLRRAQSAGWSGSHGVGA